MRSSIFIAMQYYFAFYNSFIMNRANYFAKQTKEDLQLIKLFREELTRINVLYLQAINSDDMSKADRLLKKLGVIAKTLENEY